MSLSKAVAYAIKSMELEGFEFTSEEKEMWNKIANGELPLSAADQAAIDFDKRMRELYPDKYSN